MNPTFPRRQTKTIWVAVLLGVFIFCLSSVSAWSNNTFNNSLTSENLTFTGNQNITRWLSIPQNTILTKGFLNFSGYSNGQVANENITLVNGLGLPNPSHPNLFILNGELWMVLGRGAQGYLWNGTGWQTNSSITNGWSGEYPNTFNKSATEIWSISGSHIGGNYLGTSWNGTGWQTNATIINGLVGGGSQRKVTTFNMGSSTWLISSDFSGVIDGYLWNGTGWNVSSYITNGIAGRQTAAPFVFYDDFSSNYYLLVGGQSGGFSGYTWNDTSWESSSIVAQGLTATSFITSSSIVKYQDKYWAVTGANGGGTKGFYLTPIYINNSSLTIANSQAWNYSGTFNKTNNRTNNLASFINQYLGTCSYVGGYCYVPFTFHSDTAGILQYSDLLFNNEGILENSQTYNSSTYETSSEQFIFNFTYQSSLYVSTVANLIYNGTEYLSDVSCSNGLCLAVKTIDIPTVNSGTGSQLKYFNWNITLYDLNGNASSYSSEVKQQNVSEIFFQTCGGAVTAKTLNFTAYDEQNLTRINPFKHLATYNYWLGNGSVYKNSSFSDTSIAERVICISPQNETFKANAIIEYDEASGTNYTQRNYYFNNAQFTNLSQSINLYLLKSTEATSFILYVRDLTLLPIEDAFIFVQRYYPADDSYKTVQIVRTNAEGKSVGFFETETADYKFIIIKDGEVIYSSELQKIFPQSVPYTLTFTIGGDAVAPWESYEGISNLYSLLTFNETTKIVSYVYVDTSGSLTTGRLIVEKVNGATSNTLICNVSSSQPSGTLSCNVSAYEGNILAKTWISRSPAVLDQVKNFLISTLKAVTSKYLVVFYFFLIMLAGFIGIWNPSASIVLINAIGIIFYMIGLFPFSAIWIWAMLGVSVYLLWEINT